jgi:hypothetical protein
MASLPGPESRGVQELKLLLWLPFSTPARYFNSNRPGTERLTEDPQSPSACFDECLTVLTVATGNVEWKL